MKRLFTLFMIGILSLSFVFLVYAEEEIYTEGESPEVAAESESETEAPPEIKPDDEVSTEDIVLYSEGVAVIDMDTGAVLYSKNMNRRLSGQYNESAYRVSGLYISGFKRGNYIHAGSFGRH